MSSFIEEVIEFTKPFLLPEYKGSAIATPESAQGDLSCTNHLDSDFMNFLMSGKHLDPDFLPY